MYSEEKNDHKMGIVLPIIALGGLGVASYFIYQAWKTKHSDAETEKANQDIIKSQLNIKKTDTKIATAENKMFVKGVNAYGKNTEVNLSAQVKEAVNAFYIILTDKYGTAKYIRRSPGTVDENRVKQSFFNTPVIATQKFIKLFQAYTGKSFVTECEKQSAETSSALYKSIKAIIEVAHKKYPQTFF